MFFHVKTVMLKNALFSIRFSPLSNPMDAIQRLRDDVVTEKNRREDFQAIAPAVENGLYLVPKVID